MRTTYHRLILGSAFLFVLLFFLDTPGREVLGALIPLMLLALYNYLLFPLFCNFILI